MNPIAVVSSEEKIIGSKWEKRSRNVINITIQYPVPRDTKRSTASFDFNIFQDTAQGVANEMVSDLNVDPSFTQLIKNEIEHNVRQFQSQEAANKLLQEKAEKEKEKHIKHNFRKLQQHLDSFFTEMKQLGLHSNKEICRNLEQIYPAALQEDTNGGQS